jgi:hypothetical protein
MLRRVFRLSLLASALALGAIVGCNLIGVDGSGTAATETREVGDVTEVTLAGVGDLVVVPGEKTKLVVTADDNILPLLETKSEGGKLTLGVKSGHAVNPKTPITFTLFVKTLDKLTVSGAGNAAGEGLTGDKLEVKVSGAGNVSMTGLDYKEVAATVSGAGDITLGGAAEKLTAKISGAGDVKAAELKTATGDVTVSGAGDAAVWTTGELKARVSGAGDVRYKGSPKVDQKVSGSGTIKAMN